MKWITRERTKIDRIACPWPIRRFIDKEAEFIYAPSEKVVNRSKEFGAIRFNITMLNTKILQLIDFLITLPKYFLGRSIILLSVLLMFTGRPATAQGPEKQIHSREQLWLGAFTQTRFSNRWGMWLDVHY